MPSLSKPKMKDRTRFAKCFVIIVEECQSWLQVFAHNRVIARSNCTSLLQFITSKINLSSEPMIKAILTKTPTPPDFDITVLRLIIFVGNLLNHHEYRQNGNVKRQTLGDFVQRICEIRNSLMHTTRAVLEKPEYDGYLAEIRDIAKLFEIENNVATHYYVKKINDIDDKLFDTKDIEDTIVRYNAYIQIVIKNEMSMVPTQRLQESPAIESTELRESTENRKISCFTLELANGLASKTDNPALQVLGGIGGGAVGLCVDIVSSPVRILGSILNVGHIEDEFEGKISFSRRRRRQRSRAQGIFDRLFH